jgi:hypothetical protein
MGKKVIKGTVKSTVCTILGELFQREWRDNHSQKPPYSTDSKGFIRKPPFSRLSGGLMVIVERLERRRNNSDGEVQRSRN